MGLIRPKEAGEILGRSERAIREWVESGVLKGHLVKQTMYIDSDAVYALKDTEEDISHALLERQAVLEKLDSELAIFRKAEGFASVNVRYAVCELARQIDVLSDREKMVLCDIINGYTLEDVGEELGLTRERIRQIFNKALRRFSTALRSYKKLLNEHIELRGEVLRLKAEANAKDREIYLLRKKLNIEEQTPEEAKKKVLFTKITELGLSVRAMNCLKAADIMTLNELIKTKKTTLLKFRNFGKKTMQEIDKLVKSYGLEWSTEYGEY